MSWIDFKVGRGGERVRVGRGWAGKELQRSGRGWGEGGLGPRDRGWGERWTSGGNIQIYITAGGLSF